MLPNGDNLPAKTSDPQKIDNVDGVPVVNISQIAADFIVDTAKAFDVQGRELTDRWRKEHDEIDSVINALKTVAGLDDGAASDQKPDRGMPIMEALSQSLKTRVEHAAVWQKHLDSRSKFIATLKAASQVVVNVNNGKEDKTGDAELMAMLNEREATNYNED